MRARRKDRVTLGAVAYDPKVVTIWEGFKAWFEARDLPFEYVLFPSYERQVEAHLRRELDVAWNSPLAWLQTAAAARREGCAAHALAMRDTDRDLTSVVLVRAGGPVKSPSALSGRRVAVGASDSPQATLIPLHVLAEAGATGLTVLRHEVMVGKHGDHVGGERDAVKALLEGRADAACLIDANRLAFAREGLLPPGSTEVLLQTPPYDHCNFSALDAPGPLLERFVGLLAGMSYSDPAVRPLLELEGLTAWLPGRTEGYRQLEAAVARFGILEPWLAQV